MASFMADLGARLVDNGYAVIPIMPGTKKPGRFVGGAWRDYPGWTKHCRRATTENEIAVWSQWPDAGIGIAGGTVAAVDIDVADGAVAVRIAELARERLGETSALRIGRAPKRLLVYRTQTPFNGFKLSPIEMLCEGQQFVAFATIARFDVVRCMPLVRLPGGRWAGRFHRCAGRCPPTCRRRSRSARRARQPGRVCVWHVVGLQRSIREWAMRQGWGGRRVRVEQAQGILVAALGVLAGFYGYGRR